MFLLRDCVDYRKKNRSAKRMVQIAAKTIFICFEKCKLANKNGFANCGVKFNLCAFFFLPSAIPNSLVAIVTTNTQTDNKNARLDRSSEKTVWHYQILGSVRIVMWTTQINGRLFRREQKQEND